MATANLSFSLHNLPYLAGPSTVPTRRRLAPRRPGGAALTVRAVGGGLLGDFGARDPFPAELESKFGEKVLGNMDTEHKILIPNLSALSLSQQLCQPVDPLQPPMSEDDATKLLKKVWVWVFGVLFFLFVCLCDSSCGCEVFDRITERVCRC